MNYGTIERSSSSALVFSEGYVGGLVAENDGLITQSFSSGEVDGDVRGNPPGGLIGINSGTLTQSYFSGPLDVYWGGGLVGAN